MTPVATATSDVVSYILGYGVLGLVALAFFFRMIVPASVVKEAREQGRTDLRAELDRVIAEKKLAEEQRDAAQKLATDQLVPALIAFTSTTQSLIPLLQQVIADQEARRGRNTR